MPDGGAFGVTDRANRSQAAYPLQNLFENNFGITLSGPVCRPEACPSPKRHKTVIV